jgi:hypothetical protein
MLRLPLRDCGAVFTYEKRYSTLLERERTTELDLTRRVLR